MGLTPPFHTNDPEGDKLVHHNQGTCEHALEILRTGHFEAGAFPGSRLCESCAEVDTNE